MAREHAGYKSGRMAALRMGWKYPTYAAHESGWRTFPPKVAEKYAKAFNVHADFLLFGTRPPDWWTGQKERLVEVVTPIRYMSMFVDQSAGEIERLTMEGQPARSDYCIADLGDLPPGCFAVRVRSDELRDIVPPGSILIMDRNPEVIPAGSIVLLSVKRQTAPSLRKVRLGPGGKAKYIATNENYEPIEDNEARVLGLAVLQVSTL